MHNMLFPAIIWKQTICNVYHVCLYGTFYPADMIMLQIFSWMFSLFFSTRGESKDKIKRDVGK